MRNYNNLDGDIWTHDDDLLLAETVLRHVRDGRTVVDACREMEEKSNGKRTATASKYRWFTKLKLQYAGAYEIAKQDGKKVRDFKKKRVNQGERLEDIVENVLNVEQEREITLEDIMVLVKRYKKQEESKGDDTDLEEEISKLKRENEKLRKENKELKQDNKDLKNSLKNADSDYKQLKGALDVLKQLGVNFNTPEPATGSKYIVNKDGIVERVDRT